VISIAPSTTRSLSQEIRVPHPPSRPSRAWSARGNATGGTWSAPSRASSTAMQGPSRLRSAVRTTRNGNSVRKGPVKVPLRWILPSSKRTRGDSMQDPPARSTKYEVNSASVTRTVSRCPESCKTLDNLASSELAPYRETATSPRRPASPSMGELASRMQSASGATVMAMTAAALATIVASGGELVS